MVTEMEQMYGLFSFLQTFFNLKLIIHCEQNRQQWTKTKAKGSAQQCAMAISDIALRMEFW
jgi:hypothetical protein